MLKPPGMTSSDVVVDIRRIFGERRVGHTGTLDPAAAGVLPICIGRATRLFDYLVDKEKEYKAIDTPVQKKNFQDKVANDFKAKESAFLKQKVKSEDEIYNKIKEATKTIMVEHKLSAVISDRAVFVGGVDVTNLVIDKLKGGK